MPPLMKPEFDSFLMHLSIGAANLRPFTSLIFTPLFLLPKVSCLALEILKPRNIARSLFKFVILVLDLLTSKRSSSFRNFDTL